MQKNANKNTITYVRILFCYGLLNLYKFTE